MQLLGHDTKNKIGGPQRFPQTTHSIVTALSSSPELDGKTVLLKTPHTPFTGYREAMLERGLEASSLLPSLHSTKR